MTEQNCFTEAHPTFSGYVVIGGHTFPGYEDTLHEDDDTFTVRFFVLKERAEQYGRSLMDGTDDWACTNGRRYNYARIHTVGNDGRISPNSYFTTI